MLKIWSNFRPIYIIAAFGPLAAFFLRVKKKRLKSEGWKKRSYRLKTDLSDDGASSLVHIGHLGAITDIVRIES